MKDEETIAAYNKNVNDYAAFVKSSGPDQDAQAFLESLPPNAHVLDLGCGPGNSSRFFKDAGHIVDAIDASPEMVRAAKDSHGLNAIVGTFDDVNQIDYYDGIWANFSLLHAPRDKFHGYLEAIHKALKPNGIFHIGMKLGSDSKRDKLGRFYAYYSKEELNSMHRTTGFEVFRSHEGKDVGLAGDFEPWIILQSRANK